MMPARSVPARRGRGIRVRTTEDSAQEDRCDGVENKTSEQFVPTTIGLWLIGALNGEQNQWFMEYIESGVFKSTRHKLKLRTRIDLHWLVAAFVGIKSGKEHLPKIMEDVLDQVKAQVASSITLGNTDSAIQGQLLQYVRNGSGKSKSSLLNLRGQHDERDKNGKLKPLAGEMCQAFWHNGTLFILDEANLGSGQNDRVFQNDWTMENNSNPMSMTVHCFGHSNIPILKLLKYLQKEAAMSDQLEVTKIASTGPIKDKRDKRSLDSIDMEPKMKKRITQEVEDFFHPDSRTLYRATSRPYRMGFLLHGPPGTGKTSLSVAIASHVGHPLVTITLRSMDDTDLEKAFADPPKPCIILLEDIDVSSAEVGDRKHAFKAPASKRCEVFASLQISR